MKDHPTPRSSYAGAAGYPAAGPDPARRAFLGQVVAGATALAGLALPRARATARSPEREKVSLDLDTSTPIAGTSLRFRSVDVFTADPELARYLRDPAQRSRLRMAALGPLRRATAQTLQSGRQIYQLERQVAARLIDQYRTRTRRRVTAPDVMLHVGERWAVHTGGVVVRPSYGNP